MKVGTELDAINRAFRALDWLPPEGKARAVTWLANKFCLGLVNVVPPPPGICALEVTKPEPTEGAAHG